MPGRPRPLKLLKRERAHAEAVVLEVELDGVLAGRERLRAFPLDALQIDQVPQEHRLALEQVEAVAGEAPARGQDHALGTAFGHGDVRGDGVGRVRAGRANRPAAGRPSAACKRTRCGRR